MVASRVVIKCACGHSDEIILSFGGLSVDELKAIRRQPCMRCQKIKRDKKRDDEATA